MRPFSFFLPYHKTAPSRVHYALQRVNTKKHVSCFLRVGAVALPMLIPGHQAFECALGCSMSWLGSGLVERFPGLPAHVET